MNDLEKTEVLDVLVDEDEEDDEEEYEPRKTSMLLKVLLFFIFVLLLVVGLGYYYYTSCLKPVQTESEVVTFKVDENSTVLDVTNKLKEEGLIKDAKIAYYYSRFKELTNIYMGEYNLDKNMPMDDILRVLNDPLAANQSLVNITIVEGDWAKHIAEKLSKDTDTTYEEYVQLWNDENWIKSLMNDYPFLTEDIFKNENSSFYLEGYLAPDTYQFKTDSTAEEITLKILDETKMIYDNYKDDIKNSDLSTHELYTLASIIQFEAGNRSDDQKEISGIFYNRLGIDMRLESSVTVCYAIDYDRSKDSWEECETNIDVESPYNTYRNEGLPPGPICNFSASCLDAALHPHETNNYYFMADVYGDGTIYYAETFEEHSQNVQTYLLGGN